jgi:flagellin
MSYTINTNTNGLFATMYGKQIDRDISKSMEKLSTGLRLNRSADGSSDMSIANQLRKQADGLTAANKNAQDAIGLVKIADSALQEYSKILSSARDKAIAASNDTSSTEARAALEEDVKKLLEQADEIAKTTSFNGINLLDGSFTDKKFHIGSEANQVMTVSIDNTDIASQNIADADIDLTTQTGAEAAITSLDAAIKSIDGIAANIGSTQIALESRVRVNEVTAVNVKAAESQLRDVDYASEQEILNKNSIKAQANAFALSKSFEQQSLVLNLLR